LKHKIKKGHTKRGRGKKLGENYWGLRRWKTEERTSKRSLTVGSGWWSEELSMRVGPRTKRRFICG